MLIRVFILTAALATAAACSEKSYAVDPPDTVGCITIGVTVVPSSATIQTGDTLRLRAIDPPCIAPMSYTWHSSDTTKATVDSLTGLVRGRLAGVITITAAAVSDPAVKGAMVLTVTPRP